MGIPNLLDPRMLSQVGETPPLQQNPVPVNLSLPPAPVAPPASAPPPFVPPPDLGGTGMDALPRTVTRQSPQPTFAQILVQSIPLLLAGIAARKQGPAATSGMLAGYADAMEKRRLLEEKQHQFDVETAATEDARQERVQQYQATRQARIGTWMTSVVDSLQKIDDPGSFAAAVKLYDDTGVKALGLPPGFIQTQFGGTFDNTKAMSKAQKDADAQIKRLQTQWGDQFNDLLVNNALVQDATGKDVPIRTLMATAGLGAKSAEGQGIDMTPPRPAPKSAFEQEQAQVDRIIKQEQKDRGGTYTAAELTKRENEIRADFAKATRAEPAPAHTTGLYNGVVVQGTVSNGVFTPVRDAEGHIIRAAPTAQDDKRIWITRNGNTLFINPSQVQPGDEPFKSSSTKPVTGVERQALAFYNRAKEADTITSEIEPTIAQMGLAGQARLEYAPSFVQSDLNQSYRQAQRAFTEARLRKESGAAISDAEYKKDAVTYFAQPGDSQKTITQKQKARQTLLDGMAFSAGAAYEQFYGEPRVRPGAAIDTPAKVNVKVDQPVPANVAAALKDEKPGRHTLSDGSVWIKGPDGSIAKGGK